MPTGENIARDLPCVQCGYNLRGLSPAGRFPECGADIASLTVLDADSLERADPLWVRTMREGVVILLVVAACELALGTGALYGLTSGFFGYRRLVFDAVTNVIACYGVWKLAAPEHEGLERLSGSIRRWAMRGGTATWVISSAAQSIPGPPRAVIILALTAVLGAAVMTFASIQHLSALAGRLRSRALEVQFILASVLMTISLTWTLMLAGQSYRHMNPQPPIGNVRGIPGAASDLRWLLREGGVHRFAYVLLSPGVSAWLCVLLVVLCWKLGRALKRAKANAVSEGPTPPPARDNPA